MLHNKRMIALALTITTVGMSTVGFDSMAADPTPSVIKVKQEKAAFEDLGSTPQIALVDTKALAKEALKSYEQKAAEEKKQEEEKKAKEAEAARQAEEARIAEEQRQAEEARLAEEARAAEEAAAQAEEQAAEQAALEAAQQSGDLELLASIIFCEAGNQPYDGQVAVGAVIMNRVKSDVYPNSISEVIYQGGQFGPVSSGWLDSVRASQGYTDTALQAAADAMAGSSPVGDCLYFGCGDYGIQIGDHFFH